MVMATSRKNLTEVGGVGLAQQPYHTHQRTEPFPLVIHLQICTWNYILYREVKVCNKQYIHAHGLSLISLCTRNVRLL